MIHGFLTQPGIDRAEDVIPEVGRDLNVLCTLTSESSQCPMYALTLRQGTTRTLRG